VLLWPHRGATAGDITTNIKRVEKALRSIRAIELSNQGREQAEFASGLVGPVILPLQVTVDEGHARDIVRELRARLQIGHVNSRIESHLLGESALAAAVEAASKTQIAQAEKIGFPLLLVVLLTIFGSLSAAALPLVLGATAVLITGAIVYFLSLATQLSTFTVNSVSMFGIGVAVDYSLIVLSRVRQELRAGRDLADARRIALETSGSAVAFSGLIVIASLAGVWVVPINALRSMALGAVLVVAMSVLTSVTLLPCLITMLGSRWARPGVFAKRFDGWHASGNRRMSWERWTQVVTRHPIASIAIVGGALLTLCIPVMSMKTSTGALQQLDSKNETRIGFTEAANLNGPGFLAPIIVTLHSRASAQETELHNLAGRLRGHARGLYGVRQLGPLQISPDRRYALFTVIPSVNAESAAAEHLVRQLRSSSSSEISGIGMTAAVGGASASQLDEERKIATSLWAVIAIVLGTSFLILMVVLRSLLLPFKAIVMNLLSVGVAYGVLVVVFQWGWLDSLFDYHSPGHLYTLVPPLILAVVFGLSTDYEVFLLSRVREQWLTSGDSRRAVAEGLAASAGTISSAALILVCVFAVFVGTGIPTIKELGVGAAVAIAIDATLIRLILVPATMELLGDWNWWLPGPVERLLARPSILRPAHTTSPA
jgi:RND superfamily putative drug exporter